MRALGILLAIFICLNARAATQLAASASFTDVSNAVALATNHGDVVLIPAGNAIWTNQLTINKTISIVGQTEVTGSFDHYTNGTSTVGSLTLATSSASTNWIGRNIHCSEKIADETIVSSVVEGVSATLSKVAVGAGNNLKFTVSYKITNGTIIDDRITDTGNLTRDIFRYTATIGYTPVIQGITFDRSHSPIGVGVQLHLMGTNHTFRVTQCVFENHNTVNLSRYSFYQEGDILGVMDHCYSIQYSGSEKFSVNHEQYNATPYTDGQASWTEGANWYPNTGKAFFFDDMEMVGANGNDHGFTDGQHGGRSVHRYSYFYKCRDGNHGCETGHSGMRMRESYGNYYDYGNTSFTSSLRSATFMAWSNSIYSTIPIVGWQMVVNRARVGTAPGNGNWGVANGFNPLDKIDTEGNGTYVAGHAGYVFGTGTITASTLQPTGVPTSISVSGINGTNNWTAYSLSDVTTGNLDGSIPRNNSAWACVVESNTGNSSSAVFSVTAADNPKNPAFSWAVGDTVVLGRILATFEAPGMGKHDFIKGNPPVDPTNSEWPNENIEPCYSWMNTLNGTNYQNIIQATDLSPAMTENHHWFNQNMSFAPSTSPSGTISTGVGYGTHANRPIHCTPGVDGAQPQSGTGNAPGVAYWETDTQTLFAATGVDTWTAYYQPYVYPHPLSGGGPPLPPHTPIGLLITSSGPPNVSLDWDDNSPNDFVIRYYAYRESASGVFTNAGSSTTSAVVLSNMTVSHFFITASNSAGESSSSGIVPTSLPTNGPPGLRVAMHGKHKLQGRIDILSDEQ